MSFILDALRKSENERQRKQQPGMAGAHVHKPRRGSGFWIPLVMLLVGINITLVFVMWVMGDRAMPSISEPPAPTPLATAEVPPAPAAPEPVKAAPTTPPPLASTPSTVAAAAPPKPDIYRANANEEYDDLPTIEELILSNQITITPLRLDIHVFSDKPAERFVFINMNKYTEGATLEEGPKLLAITDSGVVLLHQGKEFLVSRE